jgi:hypothetical protein
LTDIRISDVSNLACTRCAARSAAP